MKKLIAITITSLFMLLIGIGYANAQTFNTFRYGVPCVQEAQFDSNYNRTGTIYITNPLPKNELKDTLSRIFLDEHVKKIIDKKGKMTICMTESNRLMSVELNEVYGGMYAITVMTLR